MIFGASQYIHIGNYLVLKLFILLTKGSLMARVKKAGLFFFGRLTFRNWFDWSEYISN